MTKFIKSVCILVVSVILFTTTAFASENVVPKASNYFAMTSTYIDRDSNSNLEIWFDVTATGTMSKLGVSLIKLQRSTDRSNWTTIKTYEMTDYPQMICTNTAGHADCVTYSGSSTYYYRAYVEFYAKNSTGTAEYSRYTATV